MTLTVENASFGYGEKELLSGVGLSVSSGEIMAVLGPNGAGKTTLLRCIMGFLKWHSGDSYIDGKSIRSIPSGRLWSRMSYVPQAKEGASAATVREAVVLGRISSMGVFSQPGRRDVLAAEEALDRLGILSLADKSCRCISGGELQMVLIARALASEPELLVLDEPESNLDFRNQLVVLETITELADRGIACVFNTHFPEHALQRADKALLLSGNGKCIFGDTSRVVTESSIEKFFGVKAVIGETETQERVYRSVMPVELSDGVEQYSDESRIAVVSVIVGDYQAAERINEIVHRYSDYLIGRMGMPYRRNGTDKINIINLTLEAPGSEINALVSELSRLRGVSVKATYAKR